VSEVGALPSLADALGWTGLELDSRDGQPAGRVYGIYADADGGTPAWLIVAFEQRAGRFSFGRQDTKAVVVPLRECAAMPGRVWTAQSGEAIKAAPAVDPARPLLREHEATICAYYGIGAQIGRHAEIDARPEGSITAQPASG
jgi:hypothetical protein